MRVVVVGAGMAGLTATRRLVERGHDVALIEAGSRLGGRARTVRAPFVDGQHVESGAEWVDTHHHRMRVLLDRHGLTLQGQGQQWTTIRRWLYRDGRLLSPAELDAALYRQLERFEAIVAAAADTVDDPARPHLSPKAAALDLMSLSDVSHEADLHDIALLFQSRDSQGEFAAEPHEVSLLFVAQQRAIGRASGAGEVVRAHRISEGVDALVRGMAAEVADVITTGELLLGVEHNDDSVTITTSRRRLEADHVVLACSLVALRRVDFAPALPALLGRAINELGYGAVTKTAVQFADRAWAAGYATTESVSQRLYEPTVDQPGAAGVLMSYAGGAGGRELASRTEDQRLTLIEDDMRAVHRITAPSVGGFSRAWSAHARYGGSYAVYRPGQVTEFWDVLRRRHGRVWLAGEHAATWTGYLEGAVESGECVADAILDAS
jgi:monoamine oxidase